MTAQERTRCMQEGLCFLCKGKGHRAHDCPSAAKLRAQQKSKGKKPKGGSA